MIPAPDKLLAAPIVVPALCAAIGFALQERWSRWFGILCAVAVPTSVAAIGWSVHSHGVLRHEIGGWPVPLAIRLYADGLSVTMLALSATVGAFITVYSWGYLAHGHGERECHRYWALWLFGWMGINALFLSGDIFNLYVCLEVITLSVIPLIAMAGTAAALRASLRYLLLAFLGSISYLLGVGLLYSRFGTLDIRTLAATATPDAAVYGALAFLVGGLITKSALFPLHFWLPPAHSSAPAPVSALLSSLVVTASFYILLRLWYTVFAPLPLEALGHLVGLFGCAAILWGAMQACRQERLKTLVAYSTVSQLGYLFLVFGLTSNRLDGDLVAWAGGIMYAVSHGVAKAAAFLAAGSLMAALGHDRIADMKGAAERYPVLCFAFAIAGVNLMGLPPTGGFIAKWMLLQGVFHTRQWGYGVVIIAGGLLAFVYIFRVLEVMMSRPEAAAPTAPVPHTMNRPVLVLALLSVALAFLSTVPLDLLQVGAPRPLPSFALEGSPP